MKSRTSFFNRTIFKKDITRFAPAWGAYGILMLLALVSMANSSYAYYRLQNVRDAITAMSWVNLIYGGAVAQLIFGDLFNSRMCNALHALPVRRECWFGTHVMSGVTFSLVPNLVLALIALPALRLEGGWIAVFWWLLGAQLQYIFFFGIAVLCIMLSGNRLGQIALYALINLGGFLAFWMASAIYQPFLHGIQFPEEPFMFICPLGRISQTADVLVIDYERIANDLGELENFVIHNVKPGEGWGYMAICAGVGILALGIALVLYRRRKLECAGDFVAFSAMEPVVTVIATVFIGVFFHLFADAFGMNLRSVMLGAGMVIGFFACRMLLERTARVFRKKAFLFCGTIVAVFGLTVLLTFLDPLGVTRYVPAMEDVESVTFSQSYSLGYHNGFPFTAAKKEDLEAIRRVHEMGIRKATVSPAEDSEEEYYTFSLRLEYKLKNGKTVNRFYEVHPHSEAGQILKGYFTRPECVIGITAEQVKDYAPYVRSIYTNASYGAEYNMIDDLDVEGMFRAIIADCEAGNMAQTDGYHFPENYEYPKDPAEYDGDSIVTYLEIGWDREGLQRDMQSHPDAGGYSVYGAEPTLRYTTLRIYRSCVNTLQWMRENDLLTEEELAEMGVKFGGPTATFETSKG